MIKQKIYIGSDHAGFKLKNIIKKFLSDNGYNVEDIGPYKYNADDDYPDYATRVCTKVLQTNGRGILICGSGHGMAITANKFPGIRATVCWNKKSAEYAKEHTAVNVLCLGARLITEREAKVTIKTWLKSNISKAARHKRRINKIKIIEMRMKNAKKR